ncbi:MAG: type II toxin-antitoxin system Phd/YefM family antitoxin [Dehalococcoidia bacterium]|nr:type II toxin-antitoxin system Phd/YefM family antitoxin [Dehalococcoidia bacterium]
MATWQLQDAKNRFSAVVNAALDGEPQRVTRRGKPAVVVIAVEEYERLCKGEPDNTPTFVEHLLSIPKAPDDDTFELPPRTKDFHPGEIDF